MSYSLIITGIIVIFAAFTQIMVLKAVKFGIKCGHEPEKAVKEPIFELPKKEKEPEPPEIPEEALEIVKRMEMLDNFDGMPSPIKENE